MNPTKIRSLLFDLGNVIIDLDLPGAHARFEALLKKNANQDIIHQTFLDYECGKISTDIFINQVLNQCDHKVQALDIIEAWNSVLIGIPRYRLDLLETLRERYQVYAISNTNALHAEWIEQYMEKAYNTSLFNKPYFDTVYLSHSVGDRKPNPSFFEFVIEDSFLTPANTLFMDDTKENIDTAARLGFKTYFVKPGIEIAEYMKLEGFY